MTSKIDSAFFTVEKVIADQERVLEEYRDDGQAPLEVLSFKIFEKVRKDFEKKWYAINFMSHHWLKVAFTALRLACDESGQSPIRYMREAARLTPVSSTLVLFAQKTAKGAQEEEASGAEPKEGDQMSIWALLEDQGLPVAISHAIDAGGMLPTESEQFVIEFSRKQN